MLGQIKILDTFAGVGCVIDKMYKLVLTVVVVCMLQHIVKQRLGEAASVCDAKGDLLSQVITHSRTQSYAQLHDVSV